MSFEAKQTMLRDLEEVLGNWLTVTQSASVMEALSTKIAGYDVELSDTNGHDNEAKEFIEAFLAAKQVEGKSPKTIKHYRYVLGRFFEIIPVSPRKVTVYHIRKYLSDLKTLGNSDRTLEGYRTVVGWFFKWLNNEGLISGNPAANVGRVKYQKKLKRALSDVDMEHIWEVCDARLNRGPRCTGVRNKAIISFLHSTGCRVSELCSVDRDSVDLEKLECTVHGKGNKDRTVFMDSVTAMLLRRYLQERTDSNPALFIGKRSDRLTPGGIRCMLKKIQEASGVENIHPHRFRRTLATNLVSRGMPIQEVSVILGHEHIDTTMTYVCIDNDSTRFSYHKYT